MTRHALCTLGDRRGSKPVPEHFGKCFRAHRLGHEVIHAGVQTLIAITIERVRGECDDGFVRGPGKLALVDTDLARGFQPVFRDGARRFLERA